MSTASTCSFTINRYGEVLEWIEGNLPYFLESCFVDYRSLPSLYRILARKLSEDIRAFLTVADADSQVFSVPQTGLRIRNEIGLHGLSIRPFFSMGREGFVCTLYSKASEGEGVAPGLPSLGVYPLNPAESALGRRAGDFNGLSEEQQQHTLEVMSDLNQLYARTISELNASYEFLQRIQNYGQVAHLLFDRRLRLKRFVPRIGNYAGVTPYDLGSPLKRVLHAFDPGIAEELSALAQEVYEGHHSERRIFADRMGHRFQVQLHPFNSPKDATMGVLLTLSSIEHLQDETPAVDSVPDGFELFFDSSPDMYVIFDARGFIKNCNRSLLRTLGYKSRKDIVGRHLGDFCAPNNGYKLEEKLKQLRNGLSVSGLHKLIMGRKGQLIPVEVHANPICDEQGRTIAYMGIWRDMRGLNRAEEMVSTLWTAFPHTQDDFWDFDLERRVFTTCHSIEEWFGYTPDELPEGIRSWFRLANPRDLQVLKKTLRSHWRSRGRQPFALEMKFRRKDGKTAYVFIRGRVVDWDAQGRPRRMMGTHVDIAHLRKVSELEKELHDKNQAFDELMEGTAAGYWDWDIRNGVEYMSATYKRMFGYSEEEMPDRPEAWQRIVHPDDLKALWKNFEQHAESRGTVPFESEVRFFHKEGHIVWVWCRGKVIEWDEQGQPVRMIGSHIDITQLKNLDQTNKELERFAYIASHDLQEPLRTIIDFSRLMKDEYPRALGEEGMMYLNFIKESAEQMSTLVRDILTYSRSMGPTIKNRVDLNAICQRSLMHLYTVINEKQARVDADLLPTVVGHETELYSLFMNLLGNALKFHLPGTSPRVHIAFEDSPTHWKIIFSDEGIGIAREDQQRIFEIFQRLHNREDYEGNGIGLAHCLRIARNHGGGIEVRSEQNKGSTFIVSLCKTC